MSRGSVRSIVGRLLGIVAVTFVAVGVGASAARSSPGLLFGFTDNSPMAVGKKATAPALALGARGFGYFLVWQPGKGWPTKAETDGLARAIAASPERA